MIGSWYGAAQQLLGGGVLAILAWICFQLQLGLATAGLVCLTAIVLLSLRGSFISSSVLSIIAVACLNYFFASRGFSIRTEYPKDFVLVIAFLLSSLIVTRLVQGARQQTEAALQGEARAGRAEREFRLAIDEIPALIWCTFPDGSVDFINRRWEGVGLSEADLRGSGWATLIHPDERAAAVEKWHTAVGTGTPYENIARVRRAGGEYRWTLSRARPLRDDFGKIIKWYGTDTDIEDQMRAEVALRRSEAYLAEAQRLSHTGSWAWDVRRRETVYWSSEAYRIYGFDPEKDALSDQAIRDRIHPEDRRRIDETWERALRDREGVDLEHRLLMPDGSVKYLHVVAHVLGDKSGSFEFVGAVMDVTEQHAARAALQKAFDELKKSGDHLRLVIDTIPALVWSALPDGSMDFVSQRWLTHTGLSLEQALGWGWTRAYHPEDRSFFEIWRASLASGEPAEAEARIRGADGKYRWFLVPYVPLRDEAGSIVKWYGTCVDIEDRKSVEDALRRSESYLAEAQKLTHTGSWAWRVAGREALHLSEEWYRIYGFDPKKGLSAWEDRMQRIHPEDRAKLREKTDRAVAEKTDYEVEHRILLPDGTVKYTHTIGHPVLNATGDVVRFVGTMMDVTAAKRAEEELHKTQAELAHVTRVTTLGELTASIAHEVNQPLAAIVTNAEACLRWLDRGTPNMDEARRSVEWIIKDGNRAADVIQRVRALSKKTDTQKLPIDINDVVNEGIALVQRELFRHRVSLRTELAPALPVVLADRVQLQQVIINLVINGIEAMQAVTDRPRELVIRSHQDELHQALVTVMDCGVGISAETADRLFIAYFTTKSSGMGMGLSICRSIIEAHGGRLTVFGNVGPGATFQFALPAYRQAAS